MVTALRLWTRDGKQIPLAWNHSSAPADQIGFVRPETAKAVGNEVVVEGKIDLDTEVGQHAWRMVKAGTAGFSFGYLVPDGGATKRRGGGRNITALDVFELTLTPSPMNRQTRVLGYKTAEAAANHSPRRVPTDEDLRAQVARLGLEMPISARNLRERASETTLEFVSGQTRGEWKAAAKAAKREDDEREQRTRELRRQMDEVRLEVAVGDTDLVREARAKARATTEHSADRAEAIRDEWRASMLAAMAHGGASGTSSITQE